MVSVSKAVLFSLLLISGANAAETPADSVAFTGLIDVRPSYTSKTGEFHTENSVEAGAKLSPKVTLTYQQAVNTNIYNPEATETAGGGLNPTLDVGFIRTRVKDVWSDKDSGLSLSYQNRVYVPVDDSSIAKRQIVAVRNYITLSKKVSDSFSIDFSEIPILFVNAQAGTNNNGTEAANAFFENRVYVVPNYSFTEKLTLSAPIMFHQTRFNDYQAGAKNNASWSFFAWVNPELDYALTDNYTLGVAYYSDNLVKSDLSGITLGEGLEKGVWQLVFTASL